APSVASIVRAGSNPTNLASVSFTVTFSESVSGVGTSDFGLATTGVSGASITSVSSGPPSTYTVTVNTSTRNVTIELNLFDDDTIVDAAANKLGGTGVGNGNFTGQVYTVQKDNVAPTTTASTDVESYAAAHSGWNHTNVMVMLSAVDNVGGTGVQKITYSAT